MDVAQEELEALESLTIQATASPVDVGNIPTIKAAAPITLLAAPFVGGTIPIEAPLAAIHAGCVFSARFLSNDGAQRVLMHCISVERGARDKVQARVLSEPLDSTERADQRTNVHLPTTARTVRSKIPTTGRSVPVAVIDVSLTGAGISSRLEFEAGDVIALKNADEGETLYLVIRRDLVHGDRYGLKALSPEQGAQFFSAAVGKVADDRAAARQQQVRDALRAREDKIAMMSGDGGEPIQRMWTRVDLDDDGKKR